MWSMRRVIALGLVAALAATLVTAVAVPVAHAGAATDAALALASFAVFNQLVGGFFYPRPVYAYPAPVYYGAPAYYAQAPVYYAAPPAVVTRPAPAATYPRVVQYPHGRYELRGDGVYTAYEWVWIPGPPPPPPPPGSPPPPPPAR
jgi:hypothetical protein